MVVYRPDYPLSDNRGRAKRAHVVWWIHHKTVPPKGYVIHHINHNSLDDRPENLLLMTRKEHSLHHHEKNPPSKQICGQCNNEFTVQFNIISQHLREGRKYGQRFCSPECASTFRRGKRGKSYRGITEAIVRSIRKRKASGERVVALAKEYNMSLSGIYAIVRGDNWSDVE